MDFDALTHAIFDRRSYLCVGLDTVLEKLPEGIARSPEGMLEFNSRIIEATRPFAVAYKINTAFYECLGSEGWDVMQQTFARIPSTHFKIADAKRGDIGNTGKMYAQAFFETMDADAITLSPYMGGDSISPFLAYPNKWAILLALTSNPGSKDFQLFGNDSVSLFEHVIEESKSWASHRQMMYVVGATRASYIARVRERAPEHFLLVPGVGAQGGSLEEVSEKGLNPHGGLLINSSRSVIYASDKKDFDEKAGSVAKTYQTQMDRMLESIS